MRLSAIFLTDVANVNVFQESEQFQMTEGDAVDIYFQLRDISVQTAYQGYKNPGRRYMPAAGATLVVQIDTMNSANVASVTKTAIQPFLQDPSIWKISLLATDPVAGTKRIKLTLTEGAAVTNGIVNSAILATPMFFGPMSST
jgi:hypothetical protein